MTGSMHRRTFLGAMLALASTITAGPKSWYPGVGTASAAASLEELELARRLTGLLRAQRTVALLGKMALWHRNPAPGVGEVLDGVLPGGLKSQHRRSEKWQLRRLVKSRLVADYAALRMESVGGWLLSRTETRIAALAALDQEPPG